MESRALPANVTFLPNMIGAVRLNLQPLPGELLRDTRVNHICAPVNKEQKHLEIRAGVNTGLIKGGS